MITLTKEQLSEVMCKHAEKENGVNDLLEIMLESLMVAERGEFLQEQADRNKGNGYRLGHTYGHGRKLEFRIPRDRFGNFHPKILAILKDQEEECERLAGSLYTKGLTQSQVGQAFDEIYGEHYSKTSISRMIEYVRRDVAEWLERGLDKYYPIVFVDCVHIKVSRKKRAATEAFYVILGVNEDATREVLGLYNSPIESASGWSNMFDDLRDRGVERIGLMVADGLSGLDKVIGEKFPGTAFQRCTTHLKRNMLARVRHGDKKALADDMREVFRTGDKNYTVEQGVAAWKEMCLKWGKDYRSIRNLAEDEDIGFHFTYLNYAPHIQAMIYTTNWIDFANLDPTRCVELLVDKGRLFGLKAYSKSLKRFIKVAIWYPIEGRMDKWQIYFSTDESMTTRDVINCYRTRFQLEFCFRDAKSYAGLNDCQARDLRRLEFHFNASFASINLAKAACKDLGVPFSVSSCKSMIHNAYMLERFICVSGLRPNPQVIDKLFKELVLFASRAA